MLRIHRGNDRRPRRETVRIVENLESRQVLSTVHPGMVHSAGHVAQIASKAITSSAATHYLSGPDLNLIASNVHYAGSHSSQPLTGTVTVINPHHATGKFDVVAFWAESIDKQGHPAGRSSVAGYDNTEYVEPPNNGSQTGHGFKISLGSQRPSWAKYVVVEVNYDWKVPEKEVDDNFVSTSV